MDLSSKKKQKTEKHQELGEQISDAVTHHVRLTRSSYSENRLGWMSDNIDSVWQPLPFTWQQA